MKKMIIFIMSLAIISGATACGNNTSDNSNYSESSISTKTTSEVTTQEITEVQTIETIPAESETEEIFITATVAEEQETDITENAEKYVTEIIETDPEETEAPVEIAEESDRILVCYFSFPETDSNDASAGASRVVIDDEIKGAMQYMAEIIADTSGGDLFRIETVQQYPGEHEPLVDIAADEKADSARPELATHIENLDDYDTIFIGYPNWWADMPMPLYTFLEEYDFSGKTIIPFNSHGGSRFSNTIETISSYAPNATVITDGFTVSKENVADVAEDLSAWVHGLGL